MEGQITQKRWILPLTSLHNMSQTQQMISKTTMNTKIRGQALIDAVNRDLSPEAIAKWQNDDSYAPKKKQNDKK